MESDKTNDDRPPEEAAPAGLDVAAVMAQIRAEVQRRRAAPPRPPAPLAPVSFAARLSHPFLRNRGLRQFGAHMFEAERNACTGLAPRRFGGPLGGLFRLAGRVLCKILNFITAEQRSYNTEVLACLWDLHEAVRRLERAHDQSRRQADASSAPAEHRQAS